MLILIVGVIRRAVGGLVIDGTEKDISGHRLFLLNGGRNDMACNFNYTPQSGVGNSQKPVFWPNGLLRMVLRKEFNYASNN